MKKKLMVIDAIFVLLNLATSYILITGVINHGNYIFGGLMGLVQIILINYYRRF